MTTATAEPIVLRVPAAGIVAGDETNPPLAGGTSNPPDGSRAVSRTWIYQGMGGAVNVPGTAAAGSILGLDAVKVNLKPGYSYDIEFDMTAFGTLVDTQKMKITILGSRDGGVTYPDDLHHEFVGFFPVPNSYVNEINVRKFLDASVEPMFPPGATYTYTNLQVTLQRLDAPAAGDLQYTANDTLLKLTEYSG